MAGKITAEMARIARQRTAAWPEAPSLEDLDSHLRQMAQWRSLVLASTYVQLEGPRIWGGLFAGMEYVTVAAEGALIPRLIGSYEDELHPHLRAFAQEGLDGVIDVGCAEGYYAVGLARMMPEITVHAYDITEWARVACGELAARNGVSDRVIIGSEFPPDGFEAFAGRRMLVMVDTEGAEVEILQPALSPALAGMNIIVETHNLFRAGALELMVQRFSPTHDIIRVDPQPKTPDLPPWMRDLAQMDQLIAVWEWRKRPTPWLVMRPKA